VLCGEILLENGIRFHEVSYKRFRVHIKSEPLIIAIQPAALHPVESSTYNDKAKFAPIYKVF
jgi:hypothetical protein